MIGYIRIAMIKTSENNVLIEMSSELFSNYHTPKDYQH